MVYGSGAAPGIFVVITLIISEPVGTRARCRFVIFFRRVYVSLSTYIRTDYSPKRCTVLPFIRIVKIVADGVWGGMEGRQSFDESKSYTAGTSRSFDKHE